MLRELKTYRLRIVDYKLAYGYPPMSMRASPDLKRKEYSAIMVSLEWFKEEIGLTVTKG